MFALGDVFWAAAVSAVPATIAAIGGLAAWKNSKAANDAVNHRKTKDEPRLVEMVRSMNTRLADLEESFVMHLEYHKENQS